MAARDRSRRRAGPSPPDVTRRPVGVIPGQPARATRRFPGAQWLLWTAIVLATFAAYYPAWHGGILWDDDAHLTRAGLQSLDGLRRIWFDVGATQQYYPAVHSAFWLLHRLFGDNTLPYHLLNIGLHASSACLVVVLLRRLAVPGAALAGVVFALHPVHVESVAWMTELKNTLSGMLYLSSALVYLRFDALRTRGLYAAAFVLFVMSLLTKSVTATLPAALLVVFWWQRGRIEWRRDVVPLVPYFAAGITMAALTAWFERALLGAQGVEYVLSPTARVLLAGRAVWFYAWTLLWPADLSFIYPRWTIDPRVAWQYLFPAAAVAILAFCWIIRGRARAPLAVALLFGGTLVPALGFVNVYPFRYSFVADHFQYLASIPLIAGLSAALVAATARRVPEAALRFGLGLPLALLCWNYSGQYADAQGLYMATLDRNPDCWLCHNNLATPRLQDRDGLLYAKAHVTEALHLNPRSAEAHNNMGAIRQREGLLIDARAEHLEALRLNPRLVDARYNVGLTYQLTGRLDEASQEYRQVLQEQPEHAGAHHNLGTILLARDQSAEAVAHFREAARLDPSSPQAHDDLGLGLQRLGRFEEAVNEHRAALDLGRGHFDQLGDALNGAGRLNEAVVAYQADLRDRPDSGRTRLSLGSALLRAGRVDEGVAYLNEVANFQMMSAETYDSIGSMLLKAGKVPEAIHQFTQAVQKQPESALLHHHLASALAAAGRTRDAAVEFRQVLALDPHSAEAHNDLGAALANMGQLEEAVAHFREALRLRPDYRDAETNLSKAGALARRREP
jgi:protein O-mannosyl-transferase